MDALERSDGVAQVQQDRAAEDEVDRAADPVAPELLHVAHNALDG